MEHALHLSNMLSAMQHMTLEDLTEELSVYIGNIHWDTTVYDLQCHFSHCGPVKKVLIPRNVRGYAFIEFENKESKGNALLLNHSYFGGRRVTIVEKYTTPKDTLSIYVGSVDWTTTTNELRQFFAQCGPMKRITIPSLYGMSKGYAYIEFQNQTSKGNALLLNQSEFKGRTLTILEKRTNIHGYNKINS